MASAEEIPPGGEGKIKVTYKTGDRIGRKTQDISVYSNDPEQRIVQLKLVLEIETLLALQPQKVFFGNIRKKALPSAEKEAVLIGKDKDTTRIKSLLSSNEHVKAELVSSGGDDPKIGQKIKISIQPGMEFGNFHERVMVLTDHQEKKRLTLFVSGSISRNILVYPTSLSFGAFRKGGRYHRMVTLMAAPDASFKILDVGSNNPDLIPRLITRKEGVHYQVNVTLSENFDKDNLSGTIWIQTDDTEQKTIQIPVLGTAFGERDTVESGPVP